MDTTTEPPLGSEIAGPWYSFLLTWNFIAGFVLVLSPILSYGDTVINIYKTKTSAGFSIDVCGIMLVSSILRIYFYFGRPYELSLLFQSICMIIIQLSLLKLALQYRPRQWLQGPLDLDPDDPQQMEMSSITSTSSSSSIEQFPLHHDSSTTTTPPTAPSTIPFPAPFASFSSDSPVAFVEFIIANGITYGLLSWLAKSAWAALYNGFVEILGMISGGKRPFRLWQWKSDLQYWLFLVRFVGIFFVLQLVLGGVDIYVEAIGFIGLMIEAFLPLPQIIVNSQRQSVEGFRLSLLASWLSGDVAKLGFFMSGSASITIQFIMCAVIQTVLDLYVGVQYLMYSEGKWKPTVENQVKNSRQRALSLKLQGVPSR